MVVKAVALGFTQKKWKSHVVFPFLFHPALRQHATGFAAAIAHRLMLAVAQAPGRRGCGIMCRNTHVLPSSADAAVEGRCVEGGGSTFSTLLQNSVLHTSHHAAMRSIWKESKLQEAGGSAAKRRVSTCRKTALVNLLRSG